MTFKWPDPPSPPWTEDKLADYGELRAWENDIASLTELSRLMNGLGENDYRGMSVEDDYAEEHPGGVLEEDELDRYAEAAFDEIDRRRRACGWGYPFALDNQGYTLTFRGDAQSQQKIIYRYLLLATRLNMSNNYEHGGIDGRALFERLSACVAREYLGCRGDSVVFGTGRAGGGFQSNVDELCRRMGEGGRFIDRDGVGRRPKDDQLDVVGWKSFSDGREGKLIVFGQCKTGTSYKDYYTELKVDAFCNSWLEIQPLVPPVRMFFLADALPNREWMHSVRKAGLLFDRCRIVDYGRVVDDDVVCDIETWTRAAAEATGLG